MPDPLPGLLPALRERHSSRAFSDRPVDPEVLALCFEAARWAPSSANGQPWRWVVASRATDPDGFERIATTLADANQRWARQAAVLCCSIAENVRDNGRPVPTGEFALGLAVGGLLAQATALGLNVRQMAGFDGDAAREALEIPERFRAVAMLALGWPGDPDALAPDDREATLKPRTRRPLAESAFAGRFGVGLELEAQDRSPS